MTTIPLLPAATAAASTDLLPVSQGGILRAASLAQVTAGLQPSLALATGQLVGRISPGTGGPEVITIGANLSLAAGTLAAVPFTVAASLMAVPPTSPDLISIAQSGINKALPYGQLMAGISNFAGLDLSLLATTATGTSASRRLSDQMADALPVEAFGAVGDGFTDDTNAIFLALSSGRAVRLAAKTYIINGQLTVITPNSVLFGTPGQSILRRGRQTTGSAWIAVQANGFRADGVIFDANRAAISADSWGVLVTAACLQSDWHRCVFSNASGASLGHGLTFLATDPSVAQHAVRDCEFANNTLHGLWVQACSGVLVEACRAHDNGQYGIVLDYNDASFIKKARLSQLLGNRAWNNARGIAIGNFNSSNTAVAIWGNANPDALSVLVVGNVCHDNLFYGLAISGRSLLVHANLCSNNGSIANSGAGILANVGYSRITANMVTGASLYGIDCGGSINAEISANHVIGHSLGINCGGSSNVRVEGNTIQDASAWAILINNVETDGKGNNFGIACSHLALINNWIAMTSAGASGILLRDGPQGVLVAQNNFIGENGAQVSNCLWANTDQVIIKDNNWNFTQRFFVNPIVMQGMQTLVLPDIADSVMIVAAPAGVQSMLSSYQMLSTGQITFVRVTASGSGYSTTATTATVAGPGTGATARCIISNGSVIGVVVSSPGSGYGSAGTQVAVSISGDGTGATATAYASVPIPEERRLRIRCNSPVRFFRATASPIQENWTGADITVAGNADIEWIGTFNTWRASFFASADYLAPDMTGGASLRSFNNGDLQLHPAGSGKVRLVSDVESTGCLEAIGRNAPEGVLAAPPGSTFRNLNGGVGTSIYVKRVGTGSVGWFALG